MAPCCSHKPVSVKQRWRRVLISLCAVYNQTASAWQVLRGESFKEQDVTPDLEDVETLLTELKVAHHRIEFHCYNNQDHYYGVLLLMAQWRLCL